jgi:hypothetical protein
MIVPFAQERFWDCIWTQIYADILDISKRKSVSISVYLRSGFSRIYFLNEWDRHFILNDYPLRSGKIFLVCIWTQMYTDILDLFQRKSVSISVYLRSGFSSICFPNEWDRHFILNDYPLRS